MTHQELVYVGLNGRVAALDRNTGEAVWEWRASNGNAYVVMLVDRDLLLVSVDGYTYALNAYTGEEIWHNPLRGYSVGPPSLATRHDHAPHADVASAAARKRASEQQSHGTSVTAG
jgi:outer membrane protein assembly factor BamB